MSLPLMEGCQAIVFGLDRFKPGDRVFVNGYIGMGDWACVYEKPFKYEDVVINEQYLSRIDDSDELVVELYSKGQ